MTREEARKAAEVMLAYADGKEIEEQDGLGGYRKSFNPDFQWFNNYQFYRIKPTSTYHRPFANAEECWEEMQKHEPMGWVKDKKKERYFNICCVGKSVELHPTGFWELSCSFEDMMHNCTFVDGTPFGKQVE